MKVYRESGLPVDVEKIVEFKDAWRNFYDKAELRAEKDYVKLQRFLKFGERKLKDAFFENVEISTMQDLQELVAEVGNSIEVGIQPDGTIIAVIKDL